jgi:hypothetical protein
MKITLAAFLAGIAGGLTAVAVLLVADYLGWIPEPKETR